MDVCLSVNAEGPTGLQDRICAPALAFFVGYSCFEAS